MRTRTYSPFFDQMEDRLVPAVSLASPCMAAQVEKINRAADFAAVPLDEMTGSYMGKSGGLYGSGRNDVPDLLASAAEAASLSIRPLDSKGYPSANGRIGLLAIGQSTTRMVFDALRAAARDAVAPRLSLINGALDGIDSKDWAERNAPWREALRQVSRSGLNARQVEVIWMETALVFPDRYGDFMARNAVYANHLNQIASRAKQTFPNLRMIFVSSRYYGGWTQRTTSPEPYAYESSFGVRDFVLSKMPQPVGVNNPAATQPVVLWGPYYWTSGTTPSLVDGLKLERSDLRADGVHPTASGSAKFGNQLLRFFTQDRFAKTWFTKA